MQSSLSNEYWPDTILGPEDTSCQANMVPMLTDIPFHSSDEVEFKNQLGLPSASGKIQTL